MGEKTAQRWTLPKVVTPGKTATGEGYRSKLSVLEKSCQKMTSCESVDKAGCHEAGQTTPGVCGGTVAGMVETETANGGRDSEREWRQGQRQRTVTGTAVVNRSSDRDSE